MVDVTYAKHKALAGSCHVHGQVTMNGVMERVTPISVAYKFVSDITKWLKLHTI